MIILHTVIVLTLYRIIIHILAIIRFSYYRKTVLQIQYIIDYRMLRCTYYQHSIQIVYGNEVDKVLQ